MFGLNAFFPEFNLYAKIFIAYIGIFFAGMYTFSNKGERIIAAFLFSFFGAILSLSHIYSGDYSIEFPTTLAVIALVPSMFLAPLAYLQEKTPETMKKFLRTYSFLAALVAGLLVLVKVLNNLDFAFAIFVLPGFIMILIAYMQ